MLASAPRADGPRGRSWQLRLGLAAAFRLMKGDGRLGVITWKHSECAIVVDFLR